MVEWMLNIKSYLVIGIATFLIGAGASFVLTRSVYKTAFDAEIKSITSKSTEEKQKYTDRILQQERDNAEKVSNLNSKINELRKNKTEVLANVSRIKHDSGGVLNATCGEPSQSKDRVTIGSSGRTEEQANSCRLSSVAEEALQEYIERAEELNVYSKSCYLFVLEIDKQRERMKVEQE